MNTCRTCLGTPADKNISELETDIKVGHKNSFDIMLFCLDIEISPDSKITTNLCTYCYGKIVLFHDFKAVSFKNNLYLKSLEPVVHSEDQKPSVYVDETGIHHENILDRNEFGPSIEDGKTVIKIEIEVKDESLEDLEAVVKEEDSLQNVESEEDIAHKIKCEQDVQLDEESLCVVQKVDSNLDNIKQNAEAVRKKCSKEVKPRQRKRQVCGECGESFQNIKEHLVQHQPKEERPMLQCETCPKLFINKKSLKKHHKNTHLGLKSKCDICNKAVIYLTKHKMQVHNKESLPYSCVSCDRRYGSKTELELHKTVHTRDLKYECDICQKKFRLRNSILVHIRGFHQQEKNYACKICAKAFYGKSSLRTHLESHSKKRLYKCNECDKAYKTMDYLRKHHRVLHSDAKNYNCEVCGKTFKRSSDRNRHMRTHTHERPYQCQQCELTFKYSGSLRKHELAHRKNHPI